MHNLVASDMCMSLVYKSSHRPSLSDKSCNRFELRENLAAYPAANPMGSQIDLTKCQLYQI